jgi:lysophospholipase L1-like esterase
LAAGAGIKVLAILPRYRELTGATADFEADDPYSWAVAQHRQAVREVSLDFGHQVLDMIDKMPPPPWSKGEGSDTHYADSVHFTAKGAELFADIVANKILNSGIEGKSNVQGVD